MEAKLICFVNEEVRIEDEGVSVEGDGHGDAPVHGRHEVVEAGLQNAHPVHTNHVPEAWMTFRLLPAYVGSWNSQRASLQTKSKLETIEEA